MWKSLLVWALFIGSMIFFYDLVSPIISVLLILAVCGFAVIMLYLEKVSKKDHWYDGSWISVVVTIAYLWWAICFRDSEQQEECREILQQVRREKNRFWLISAGIVAISPLCFVLVISFLVTLVWVFVCIFRNTKKFCTRKNLK